MFILLVMQENALEWGDSKENYDMTYCASERIWCFP